MKGFQSIQVAFAFGCIAIANVADAGGETASAPPVYPAYELKPGACYVLLKPKWPVVLGGDYPVCRAVLDNLNKFCDEPPQYDRRKVHSTTKNLHVPKWERIDARTNMDLIKQTYLASVPPEYRDERWENAQKRLLSLASSGALQLSRAHLDDELRGAQTVYMLENHSPSDPPAYDQPRLMFSEQPQQTPSPLLRPLSYWGSEDLLRYRDHWYLTGYQPDLRRFEVKQLMRPHGPEGEVAVVTRCTIQHNNDRQRSE